MENTKTMFHSLETILREEHANQYIGNDDDMSDDFDDWLSCLTQNDLGVIVSEAISRS